MRLREINQVERNVSLLESKKILTDMITKLEGGYCVVVGHKKDYQELGNELLKEWEKLSFHYPYNTPLLTELKEKLEKINKNQVEKMEKYQALADCQELLKEC